MPAENEEYKAIGIKELDDWAQNIINVKNTCSGYPISSVEDFDEYPSVRERSDRVLCSQVWFQGRRILGYCLSQRD